MKMIFLTAKISFLIKKPALEVFGVFGNNDEYRA